MCSNCLQRTRYLICNISQVDIKYTDKKIAGSEILYFDINVKFYVFYVFFMFAIKRIIKSAFTSRLTILTVNIAISENVLTQKFTFDFVAFLFSLSIFYIWTLCIINESIISVCPHYIPQKHPTRSSLISSSVFVVFLSILKPVVCCLNELILKVVRRATWEYFYHHNFTLKWHIYV